MIVKKRYLGILVCVTSLCSSAVLAEGLSVTPVMLDSDDNSGSILGLKYELSDDVQFFQEEAGEVGDGPIGEEEIDDEIYGKSGFIKYKLDGTWTVNKDENPLSTSNAKFEGGYGNFQDGYEIGASGFAGLEGNQDYSDRNKVYGLKAFGHYSFDENNAGTFIDLSLAYEQVDASEDEERMLVTDEDEFDRLSGEIQISYKMKKLGTSKTSITSLQFNYRYFKEMDAPDVIENTNTDSYKLATYMIKFNKGLYAAYSTGSLPFDKQDDKIFEIGFSQTIF